MKKDVMTILIAGIMFLSACGSTTTDLQSSNSSTPVDPVETTTSPQTEIVVNTDDTQKGEPIAQTTLPKEDEAFQPLELKDFGYAMNGDYMHYTVIVHNPNANYAVEYPQFRVTARDAEGILLGTETQTLSIIYPGQDFCFGSQAFKCDEVPTSAEAEILEPREHNILKAGSLEHENYIPLSADNTAMRENKVVGEIRNDNDYDVKKAVVVVVFRDADGKTLASTHTYVDDVRAGSLTPFDVSTRKDFATENYEVFVNLWV